MDRVRIGIKYCGGCNPYYDRVGVVEEIKERLGERFLFLRHDEKDLAGLIAVSGCSRACATKNLELGSLPSYSMAEADSLDSLIAWLRHFSTSSGAQV